MDVLTDISESPLSALLCHADSLGRLSQVSVDGILPNRRLNLAMGLAAIHTAQIFEVISCLILSLWWMIYLHVSSISTLSQSQHGVMETNQIIKFDNG